jgi:hypothetical protein
MEMLMERFVFFDRNEIPKALASFQEAGIESNPDLAGAPTVWIVENEDLERAKKILRERKILGVHKPWD